MTDTTKRPRRTKQVRLSELQADIAHDAKREQLRDAIKSLAKAFSARDYYSVSTHASDIVEMVADVVEAVT